MGCVYIFIISIMLLIWSIIITLKYTELKNMNIDASNKIDENSVIDTHLTTKSTLIMPEKKIEILNIVHEQIIDAMDLKELKEITYKIHILSDEHMQKIYQSIYDLDALFKWYNLMYWVTGGSLLAILRGGKTHIPWDDDLDICMLNESVQKLLSFEVQMKLNKMGYRIQFNNSTQKIIIIFPQHVTSRQLFADIFVLEDMGGDYITHSFFSEDPMCAIHIWKKSDLFPLKTYKYGPVDIIGPNDIKSHICRVGHIKIDDIENFIIYAPHSEDRRDISNKFLKLLSTDKIKEIHEVYEQKQYNIIKPCIYTDEEINQVLSMYFAFQWLPDIKYHLNVHWDPQRFFESIKCPRTFKFENGLDASIKLKELVNSYVEKYKNVGILLSSGIDSGTIAYCLPAGTKAYFVEYSDSLTKEDRTMVEKYVEDNNLDLQIVSVTKNDYKTYLPILMRQKRAPLHPCEIPVYKALLQATTDGITHMLAGWGCDTYFGGMDKLMSVDYNNVEEFADRYMYINPKHVLKNPVNVYDEFSKYYINNKIDTEKFLEDNYHGMTMQCFFYLPQILDLEMYCPWSEIGMVNPLDVQRVRHGEPKYMIREAFEELRKSSNSTDIPEKIPFTRPDYIIHPEYINTHTHNFLKNDINYKTLTSQQKWMLFSACYYYDLMMDPTISWSSVMSSFK